MSRVVISTGSEANSAVITIDGVVLGGVERCDVVFSKDLDRPRVVLTLMPTTLALELADAAVTKETPASLASPASPASPVSPAPMRFRKTAQLVTASQWFKNGDHPDDNTTKMPADQRVGEGDVVRYYRHPRMDGHQVCFQCGTIMHDHGWLDVPNGGHVVCPGDWVVTEVDGDRYPVKARAFSLQFEAVTA